MPRSHNFHCYFYSKWWLQVVERSYPPSPYATIPNTPASKSAKININRAIRNCDRIKYQATLRAESIARRIGR